ncbi:glucosaminidase domain-containing protein [Candidatus Daviesbacteria bacterium]|nr:glucosaminidase domain-containing protein [Candidatus Daviesbacteria bacterium]
MDTVKPQARIWFVAAWFGASTTTLIFTILFSLYLSSPKLITPHNSGQSFKLYAALPKTEAEVTDGIVAADGRAKIVENFFVSYQAPLAEHSQTFIEVADKYQLDWRLLPSIAMQESNGGKKIIEESYNPFGYGIYGKLVTKFDSWDMAIERVGRALREDYLNQGLKNPTQIMAKYTPPSLEKGGAWAKGVLTFMKELQ